MSWNTSATTASDIVTGNRSILSYIVSPLTDTIRDALRED